jgi:hypothetical protein
VIIGNLKYGREGSIAQQEGQMKSQKKKVKLRLKTEVLQDLNASHLKQAQGGTTTYWPICKFEDRPGLSEVCPG